MHRRRFQCQCDIILQRIAATFVFVAVYNNSSKTAMKRSSGSAARPTDCAADSSAEQPARHSVDDSCYSRLRNRI